MRLPLDTVGLLTLLALLNAIAKPVLGWALYEADPPNAVSFLCALAGLVYWQKNRFSLELRRWQQAGLCLAASLLLLPIAFAAWGAAALVALTLLGSARLGESERMGLLVLLAAACRTPIAEGAMILLAEPLLIFDGAFANLIGGLIGGGGTLNGNMILGAEGHAVLVMSGCASFANVSNALLIWFSVTMLAGRPKRRHLALMAGALAATIIFINAIRLGGMTVSREAYYWIHDGDGALVAEIAMMVAILIALTVSLKGYRHAAEKHA